MKPQLKNNLRPMLKHQYEKKPKSNILTEVLETSSFQETVFIESLAERKIILNRDIDDSIVEYVMMQIIKFNEEDLVMNQQIHRVPITIYINSDGGDVYAGLVLCDIIRQSATPVHTIVTGTASSMAALVGMCGHYRSAYPSSNFLIHQLIVSVAGDLGKATDAYDYIKTHKNSQVQEVILSCSNITEELLNDVSTKRLDWWLTAEEALELGIIDEIIGMESANSAPNSTENAEITE